MNYLLNGFQFEFVKEIEKQLSDYRDELSLATAIYIPDNRFGTGHKEIDGVVFYDRNMVRNVDGIKGLFRNFDLSCYLEYFHYFSSLLDRQLYDQGKVTGTQKFNLFTCLIGFYTNLFIEKKIEKIISREIPHFGAEFVMYIVAKKHDIDIVMFDFVEHLNRTLPIFDIFDRKLEKTNDSSYFSESKELLRRLAQPFKEVQSKTAAPNFLKMKKKWSASSWMKYIARDLYYILKKNPLSIDHTSLTRCEDGQLIPSTRFQVCKYFSMLRLKTFKLERYYNSLASDLSEISAEKCIAFFSHYQPERTTNPDGGPYYDILYTIRKLKGLLPEDVQILYKEHPHIFSPTYKLNFRGGVLRSKQFYNDLLELDVKLVSIYEDNDRVFQKVDAIASVTGTVLLEAVAKSKPALMFGNSWHVNLNAVKHADSFTKLDISALANELNEVNVTIEQLNNIYAQSVERIQLLYSNDARTTLEVKKMIGNLEARGFFNHI